MNTDSLILYTDRKGNLKGLPKFPPNKQIQVAFSVIESKGAGSSVRRAPNLHIAGKLLIKGDIFDTVAEGDWNLPR